MHTAKPASPPDATPVPLDVQLTQAQHALSMMTNEFVSMGKRVSAEIKMLRQYNALLAHKAEAWDMLTTVLRLLPRPVQPQTQDLAWQIDERLAELQKPKEV